MRDAKDTGCFVLALLTLIGVAGEMGMEKFEIKILSQPKSKGDHQIVTINNQVLLDSSAGKVFALAVDDSYFVANKDPFASEPKDPRDSNGWRRWGDDKEHLSTWEGSGMTLQSRLTIRVTSTDDEIWLTGVFQPESVRVRRVLAARGDGHPSEACMVVGPCHHLLPVSLSI